MCVCGCVLSDMAASDCAVFLPTDASDWVPVSTQPLLSLLILHPSRDWYAVMQFQSFMGFKLDNQTNTKSVKLSHLVDMADNRVIIIMSAKQHPVHGLCQSRRCSRTCRGQENIKILITPGFTYVSAIGSRDPWFDKLFRHLIPGQAGSTINGLFRRCTGNRVFFSKSFSGVPALQFGSLQRNIYSSYRTGLAPCHSS